MVLGAVRTEKKESLAGMAPVVSLSPDCLKDTISLVGKPVEGRDLSLS